MGQDKCLEYLLNSPANFTASKLKWVLDKEPEIYPNKIRSQAVTIAVAAQWLANFFISSTYPSLMEFSNWGTYLVYVIMSILSAVFVWKMVPDTRGKTLEEMDGLWKSK